ncbi:MAG: glycosyltransferase [Patescibacteria group bacterium]|nr:glycosyltransferase [Patescibacteria group bacterium]
MLEQVPIKPRSIRDYHGIVEDDLIDEIYSLSKKITDLRILHINATKFGGGVAEILNNYIPLLQDLWVGTVWQTIIADDRLFEVTKSFHNGLQGKECKIGHDEQRTYERFNAYNAQLLEGDWDIVVIHDPQPLAIPYYLEKNHTKWLWRCHIDASEADANVWAYLDPYLKEFDGAIFSLESFIPDNFPIKKRYVVHPAIDPLSEKNKEIDQKLASSIIKSHGLDITKPIMTQISRFDPWKDPLGVIEAYKLAKKKIDGLQLVLVGSMANDDPEGWKIYQKVVDISKKDKNIFIFTNLGDLDINAFQSASSLVIQKSIKEGFGLTVAEAMWKENLVIGGDTGGIRLQIIDGETGYLVNSVEECAGKVVYSLNDPSVKGEIGKRAKEHIRKEFLIPRLLRDELRIYNELLEK